MTNIVHLRPGSRPRPFAVVSTSPHGITPADRETDQRANPANRILERTPVSLVESLAANDRDAELIAMLDRDVRGYEAMVYVIGALTLALGIVALVVL